MEMKNPLPHFWSNHNVCLSTICCVYVVDLVKELSEKHNQVTPEAAGAWPSIGHLPLVGEPEPPHITLGDIANKYGPLFTIKLGVHPTFVVSSRDMAKECLTAHDIAFANRPKVLGLEIMGYNNAMFGSSPCGPYWRHVRKMATLHLLSNHQLELLKHVRESEVKACIKRVYDLWKENKGNKVIVEMNRWFGDAAFNIMFRMVGRTQAKKIK